MQEISIRESEEIKNNELTVLGSEIITLTVQAQKMALQYICEIGRRLIRAKELVGHGGWGEWLQEKVNYSQSTAENYMKIYREFGEEQLSLFSSVQSDKFQSLPYTKLLALTALNSEEREELAERVDIENTSVKELEEKVKEIKAERDGFAADKDILENKLSKVTEEAEKYREQVELLQKKVKASEMQAATAGADDIKKEYEEKLAKAKEKQKAAEDARKDLEAKIEEEKKKAAKEAAEKAIADTEKKVSKDKEELRGKVIDLERKLASAVNQDIPVINVYFEQIQEYISAMSERMRKLKGENAETYNKLSPAVKETLRKLINEL